MTANDGVYRGFSEAIGRLTRGYPLFLILGAVMMTLHPKEVSHPWEYLEASGKSI